MKKSIYTVDQIDALLSGKGMAILGRYDSTAEIANPVEGGHYYIGTEEPYDVCTYVNGAWVNAGPLAIEGPPGPAFTYDDFTPAQLEGLRGENGKSPYINASTNNWMVWDEEKESFVDTGVSAGGKAPSIGSNGNWFVDGKDTGVPATNAQLVAEAKAYAEAAAASAANAGKPPYVGANGNWFVWDVTAASFVDTGAKAEGESVSVASVNESTQDGGSNVVTFSDGKKLTVRNGRSGDKGDPGYTPVRGKDYWTQNDKTEILQEVLEGLGTPIAGTVDENNNIVLGGDLADGEYTLKYLNQGEYIEIGKLTISSGSVDVPPDTTLNWSPGVKIDGSTGAETTGNATYNASAYIAIVDGYTYTLTKNTNRSANCKVCYYDADKNFISTSGEVFSQTTELVSKEIPLISGASFFRIRLYDTASALSDGDYTLTAEKV